MVLLNDRLMFNPFRVEGNGDSPIRKLHLRLLLFNPFRIVKEVGYG
jgi:hypothetical protein